MCVWECCVALCSSFTARRIRRAPDCCILLGFGLFQSGAGISHVKAWSPCSWNKGVREGQESPVKPLLFQGTAASPPYCAEPKMKSMVKKCGESSSADWLTVVCSWYLANLRQVLVGPLGACSSALCKYSTWELSLSLRVMWAHKPEFYG